MIIKVKDCGFIDTDEICRISEVVKSIDWNYSIYESCYFTINFKGSANPVSVTIRARELFNDSPVSLVNADDGLKKLRDQILVDRTESYRMKIVRAWIGSVDPIEIDPDLTFPGIDLRKDGLSILPPQPTGSLAQGAGTTGLSSRLTKK